MTSTLIGASSAAQVRENVATLENLSFTAEELAAIDRHAVEGGVNLWDKPSHDQAVCLVKQAEQSCAVRFIPKT